VLDVRSCDLGEVWREAWSQVLVRYPGRDARLEEDLDETTPACDSDRFRLVQVFANLFANALDACPDPARVVVVCRGALLGNRPALRVTVRDNGPGFDPEQRRHAFEPFRTSKPKGTGLGLAIVKRIVDAHGGTIAIDDSPEGGVITLTLPLQQIGKTPVTESPGSGVAIIILKWPVVCGSPSLSDEWTAVPRFSSDHPLR
jgi:signal transduction histidine kinase